MLAERRPRRSGTGQRLQTTRNERERQPAADADQSDLEDTTASSRDDRQLHVQANVVRGI